jgi:CheY-like chemotaxis protein
MYTTLVLSGGSINGIYTLGALQCLKDNSIIDNITTYTDALSDEDSLSGTNNNSTSTSTERRSLTDSYEENNLKILIAEDDPDHQKVLRRLLKTVNCTNITIVSDGKQALDAITFQKYDIAFIDINMPVLGGIELMKSVLPMPNKPIMIAVTAVGTYGERSFYVNEIHFDEYLSKPIYAQALFDLLRKYGS